MSTTEKTHLTGWTWFLLFVVASIGIAALVVAALAYDNSTGTGSFENIDLTNTSNQITFGTGNTTTLSSPAPSSDVTLSLPITNDVLVGRNTTDTLTSKTLTSPIINNPITETAFGTIAATITLTAATSGTTYGISGGPYTIHLPAPTAGVNYKFVANAAPGGLISIAAPSTQMNGYLISSTTIVPCIGKTSANFNTTAVLGDQMSVSSDGTSWFCQGFGQSGTTAFTTTA